MEKLTEELNKVITFNDLRGWTIENSEVLNYHIENDRCKDGFNLDGSTNLEKLRVKIKRRIVKQMKDITENFNLDYKSDSDYKSYLDFIIEEREEKKRNKKYNSLYIKILNMKKVKKSSITVDFKEWLEENIQANNYNEVVLNMVES